MTEFFYFRVEKESLIALPMPLYPTIPSRAAGAQIIRQYGTMGSAYRLNVCRARSSAFEMFHGSRWKISKKNGRSWGWMVLFGCVMELCQFRKDRETGAPCDTEAYNAGVACYDWHMQQLHGKCAENAVYEQLVIEYCQLYVQYWCCICMHNDFHDSPNYATSQSSSE